MKSREIYKINYPYQEGHGVKSRPVLVFILTSTPNEFIALKITTTPRPQNRVEVKHWHEANLDRPSYIQCDNYSTIVISGETEFVGMLDQSDYDSVVLKFNEFYPIIKMQKDYMKSL